MSEIDSLNPEARTPLQETKTRFAHSLDWVKVLVAILFWIYVPIKVFVFDIDLYLISRIDPHLIWLVHYKFLILIATVSLLLLTTKSKYMLFWTLYILFYPFVFTFWQIPYFIIKQKSWMLAFAFINAVVGLLKSIKYKFVAGTVFILGCFFITITTKALLLIISITTLLVVLTLSYIRMFVFVFQPSRIFQLYAKFLKGLPKFTLEALTDKNLRQLPIENLTETQLETRRINIQTLVLSNRAILFFSKKLKDYQESRFNSISYVFGLLFLLVFTMISFAFINLGLFKLTPDVFSISTKANYFIFLYYSFHTFTFSSITEIIPIAFYSQILSMLEQFFAILFGFILVSLYFSTRNEKYKEELSRTIEETTETGMVLEGMIKSEYHLSFDQAIEEVKKLKSNFMKIILWLTQAIE